MSRDDRPRLWPAFVGACVVDDGGVRERRTWTGGELSLTRDPGGPFRTQDGPCGADRRHLREGFGLPDELIDDVVAWWTDFQQRFIPTPPDWDYTDREREHHLCHRLREAAPSDVWVQPADFAPAPILVRMFIDTVPFGMGLWSDWVGWPLRSSFDEDTLPISTDLRIRLQEWARDYDDRLNVGREEWNQRGLDHDRRGHGLSRELQAELGPGFRVEFSTMTRAGRLEGLSDRHPLTESDK